ncbi:MAG: hypothetical protein IPJ65_06780 [Archangiaceae bacterium]|nr:hypothetical protein [Archangiaceae bacterium]
MCTATSQCQAGLYCPAGASRTCTSLRADGAPCTTSTECATPLCNRAPQVGVDAGVRGCGYLGLGQPCWSNGDCGPSNHCRGYIFARTDAGAVAGTCAVKDLDGAPCTNSATRINDSCANPRATCLDGTCRVTPPYSRVLGQTCDSPAQCGSSSRCDYADPLTYEGHCVALLPDGAACDGDGECLLGSYCSFVDGMCTRYGGRNDVCGGAAGRDCLSGLSCEVGPTGLDQCTPMSAVGGTCNATNGPQCYGSFCSVTGSMCVARQANGAPCTLSSQCESRRCLANVCVMACF